MYNFMYVYEAIGYTTRTKEEMASGVRSRNKEIIVDVNISFHCLQRARVQHEKANGNITAAAV